MNGDELDKALYDCMNTIWKAYRSGDVKEYNSCFQGLYDKYDDQAILSFISGMGMGLAPAVNRRELYGTSRKRSKVQNGWKTVSDNKNGKLHGFCDD